MNGDKPGLPWKRVLVGCGVVCFAGFALMCAGVIWLLSLPEGGVRLSNQMAPYALQYLEEHEILNSSESIIAYYDVTLSLDGTEAAILTTERLIYHKGGRSTYLPLSDITDVRHRQETMIGDIIEIDSRTGVPMQIEIAPLNQGETFLNALQDALERLQ